MLKQERDALREENKRLREQVAALGGVQTGEQEGGLTAETMCPPRTIMGEPNIAYYRYMYDMYSEKIIAAIQKGDKLPTGLKDVSQFLEDGAKMAGFDRRAIEDRRTDEEKVFDFASALATGQAEEALALGDEVLDKLEEMMHRAVELCKDVIADKTNDQKRRDDARVVHNQLNAEGKAWSSRLQRVRRLREMARNPLAKIDGYDEFAIEASHPLRFMLYVNRSNITYFRNLPDRVFKIGRHHAAMAVGLWEARKGVEWTPDGPVRDRIRYMGFVGIMPPGHGKTEMMNNYMIYEVNKDPRTQGLLLHCLGPEASKNLTYICHAFQMDNDAGRRNLSLFPDREAEKSTAHEMRLIQEYRMKSPTLVAHGVGDSALGINTNIQLKDDVVPKSDRDKPTDRKKRSATIAGTWSTRQRGTDTFDIWVGTIWHEDDALARKLKESEKYRKTNGREGIPYVSVVQRVEGKAPDFVSLWPEVYPREELLRRYYEMRDLVIWSANYEANPIAEGARIVEKLRFYNPDSDEHRDFLRGAEIHASIDPAATNRETSDKASLVIIAVGLLTYECMRGGIRVIETEKRARIIDAYEFHANQRECAAALAAYVDMARRADLGIDYVHVETQSGYEAMYDYLVNEFGIPEAYVRAHRPGRRSKGERLKLVSHLVDHGPSHKGFPGASLEFPGRVIEALQSQVSPVLKAGPDDKYDWLYRQFLNFGATPDDHALDAVVYVLMDIAADLDVGRGPVSEAVEEVTTNAKAGDPRVEKMLRMILRAPSTMDSPTEDLEFHQCCLN
jgi:hypothetical protein